MSSRRLAPARSPARAARPIVRVSAYPSVPAVVADLDHPVLDAHREFRDWLVGRRGQRLPRPDAEACPVPRADDLLALDRASGELPPVVRADVLDRMVLAAKVEHHDGCAIHVYNAVAAGRKLARPRNGYPVRHRGAPRNRAPLDCDDFHVRLDLPHQALDPGQSAGDRARAAAARALVVHHQAVAIEAHDEEIAAVALQIGPNLLVEDGIDL